MAVAVQQLRWPVALLDLRPSTFDLRLVLSVFISVHLSAVLSSIARRATEEAMGRQGRRLDQRSSAFIRGCSCGYVRLLDLRLSVA